MAKKVGDLNASSQADIAFLLLIFFLVTTSMNVDQGLYRQLPPPQDNVDNHDKINERNIFIVLINKDNQLAIKGELADINSLTERTIEFITNPKDKENLAEKVLASKKLEDATKENKVEEIKNWKRVIEQFGDIGITKGVVSLQNDRGTNYETYIKVQNAIVAAYNITRDKFSQEQFSKPFEELNTDEQKLVKLVIPLNISEAEPRSIK